MKQLAASLILFLLVLQCLYAQPLPPDGGHGSSNNNGSGTIVNQFSIHNATNVYPGNQVLQLDALGFLTSGRFLSAFELHIQTDTALVQILGFENTALPGNWQLTYNEDGQVYVLSFSTAAGQSHSINGALVELSVFYRGGFEAELNLTENSVFYNENQQPIPDVELLSASITQAPPLAEVALTNANLLPQQPEQINLSIAGQTLNAFNAFSFRLGFDPAAVQIAAVASLSSLEINWYIEAGVLYVNTLQPAIPISIYDSAELLQITLGLLGNQAASLSFLPGSYVENNSFIVPVSFTNASLTPVFELTLSADPLEAGQLSGGGLFPSGSTVSISATENPGYIFQHWLSGGDVFSTMPSYSFAMPDVSLELIAVFEPFSYQVVLNDYPAGSAQLSGAGIYQTNTSVAVTAIPADGYSFLHWKENDTIVSHDATYSFVMPPADRYLSAHLATNFVTLSLLSQPEDAGLLAGAGNYEPNSEVNISAIAQPGYAFEAWLLNGEVFSGAAEFSFIMPETSLQLVAQFAQQDFQLQLIALPDGSATLSGGGSYAYEQQVDVLATLAEAYDFLHWKANGQVVSSNPAYSFLMPASDLQLTAHARLKAFAITAIPNVGNYGFVTGSGVYSYGQTATLIATPNSGYQFVRWIEAGQPISTSPEYSFQVYADRTITAVFEVVEVCDPPQGLQAEIISDSEALISWMSQSEAQQYALLWGEVGFDPLVEGDLVEGIMETEYLITNLDFETVYEVYLRTICSENSVSMWEGPLSFSPFWVSLHESKETEIKVYPNPLIDRLFVDINTQFTQPPLIKLYSQNGTLFSDQFSRTNTGFYADTDKLPAGLYLLLVTIENEAYTFKIIKR